MTPQLFIWSISTNILMVLANFLGIHNPVFLKNIGRDHGNTSCENEHQMCEKKITG